MTVLIETAVVIDVAAEYAGTEAVGGVLATLRRPYSWLRRTAARVLFEKRYNVRTADFVRLEEYGLAHAERVYYSPANWMTLRRALPRHEVGPDDVFVDLGSGMGRMVLEAAAGYPFRKVIGVELSSDLDAIARDNVAGTRMRLRCRHVELVNSDALEYAIPDDVTVVFLNNPFRGAVFASVIRNLIASVDRNPRRVKVVYFNPVEEDFLLSTGRFRLLRTAGQARRSEPEPFGTTRVYALDPHG